MGFVVTGTTLDDENAIHRDMPVLVRILNTFRVLNRG